MMYFAHQQVVLVGWSVPDLLRLFLILQQVLKNAVCPNLAFFELVFSTVKDVNPLSVLCFLYPCYAHQSEFSTHSSISL